jgi:hypothetical protein
MQMNVSGSMPARDRRFAAYRALRAVARSDVMDPILQKVWEGLDYRDPRPTLVGLRRHARNKTSRVRHSPRSSPLRSNRSRAIRESLQAALLCHAISESILKTQVSFARFEDADYDCVFQWRSDGDARFAPVQLKEVVPREINPKSSIDTVLEKLERYHDPHSLIVGIYLNRLGVTDLERVLFPRLSVRELWVFGPTRPDRSQWAIYGNVLAPTRQLSLFDYPS